jgi:hypothetical protein
LGDSRETLETKRSSPGCCDDSPTWLDEGQTIGIDATTLEAQALRSIGRRDTRESYFLT